MSFIICQCLLLGSVLYFASRFTVNAMSGLVQFAKYMSAPIALKYENSGPRTSTPSSLGLYRSLSYCKDLSTIGTFEGYAFSKPNLSNNLSNTF